MDIYSRSELDQRCIRHLRTATGTRPDLKVIDLGDDRLAVLKDYRNSAPLFRRIIGPLMTRREGGALRKLDQVDGIPRLCQAVDRHAILIEYVESTPLREIETDALGPEFFVELEKLICRMHAAGVAHCDLRTGGNILVGAGNKPYIVDFASCVFRGRGLNPLIALAFREFRRADLFAVLLAKRRVAPSLLTEKDKVELAKPRPFERPAIFVGKSIRNIVRRTLARGTERDA